MSLAPTDPPRFDHTAAIDAALRNHGLTRHGPPRPVADSVLNDNFRVETERGPLFVRVHKETRMREAVEVEHAATAWAGANGIPVARALAGSGGATTHRIAGRFVSIHPWIEGHTLVRDRIERAGAAILGAIHGRVQAALTDFRHPALRGGRGGSAWDTEASIATLSRVDDLIRYYAAPGEEQLRIQETLRFRLDRLERGEGKPASRFAALPTGPAHGDFHERNVILGAPGAVVAVVDWEGVTLQPRVFELIRSLSFTGIVDDEAHTAAYLTGYSVAVALSPAECAMGVEMWWQSVLHDTWLFRERFIRGNRRGDRFWDEDAARVRQLAGPAYRVALARSLAAACE